MTAEPNTEDRLWRKAEMAREEFRQWVKDNTPGASDEEVGDVIHEIADTSVPVYNFEILQIAAQNNMMALSVPECGPAFDGTPTPINIIAANIYEYIEAELWDEWRKIQIEREGR